MKARVSGERGSSLMEMMIAVILTTLVLSAMVGVLLQQQRFYMVAGDAANTVGTLQRLETTVTAEFMPLNPSGSDIIYADDDSLALRVFRGVYVVCSKKVTTDVFVTVRPLTQGRRISTDSVLVYSSGTRGSLADDHWKPVAVLSVIDDACPDGTPGWTAAIPDLSGLLSQIPIGSAVRVFQPASYWLSAEDGSWFLKTDANPGGEVRVASRLAPADSAAASVMRFDYLDVQGKSTSTLAEIANIEIAASALGLVPKRRGGQPLRKDQTVSIALRNAGK